jgi:hypothetical protein
MQPETPNENSSDRPSHAAHIDTPNCPNQADELSDEKPMNSAATAQSITDSNSQTEQHVDHQTIYNNRDSAAVVTANHTSLAHMLTSSSTDFGANV